jgi:lambda family phage portal protein
VASFLQRSLGALASVSDAIARSGDRVVGWVSPDAGLKRHMSRQALQRAYEGASQRDGWKPRRAGASANSDHAADAKTLRVRARSLRQNVPHIASAMRCLVGAVIGTGIEPRWVGDGAAEHNAAFEEMKGQLDADGQLDFNGLVRLAYDTCEQDGEVMVRVRHRRKEDGLLVPVQFQVLEIDWLDSDKTGREGSSTIVNGIQYDALGKREGYWLFPEHPGETKSVLSHLGLRNASRLVPAADIIHFYRLERPGQGRGFTRLAPVIAKTRDLHLYKDAELQRKNLETRLSVLVTGDPAGMANGPRLPNDPAGAPQDARDLGPLASGSMQQLPSGTTVTVVEPKWAQGFVETVKHDEHEIAAGIGVPYEGMTGDVSEANFSSARVRRLDFRIECEMTQYMDVIPRLIRPMCRIFAMKASLAGVVKRPSFNLDFATPKWDYVNPKDDVTADLDEISGGLSSISEKLRRRGYKPEEVFNEIGADFKKLKEMGVLDVLLMLRKGRAMDDGAAPKPDNAK